MTSWFFSYCNRSQNGFKKKYAGMFHKTYHFSKGIQGIENLQLRYNTDDYNSVICKDIDCHLLSLSLFFLPKNDCQWIFVFTLICGNEILNYLAETQKYILSLGEENFQDR